MSHKAPKPVNGRFDYGFYPQTLIKDEALLERLNRHEPEEGAIVFEGRDSYYFQKNRWYRFDPVGWSVLQTFDGYVFAVTERVIDAGFFDQDDDRYLSSAIRKRIRSDILSLAFPDPEFLLPHPETGDLLSLLSKKEVWEHSLDKSEGESPCPCTDYALSHGLRLSPEGNSAYWTRTASPYFGRIHIVGPNQINYEFSNTGPRGIRLCAYIKADVPPLVFGPKHSEATIPAPRIENGKLVYGVYPQSEVVDPALCETLSHLPADEDGYVLHEGNWYFRYNHRYTDHKDRYYKVEPIAWIIVKTIDDLTLICAEKLLDSHMFDYSELDFYRSDINAFLNDDFLCAAFPSGETRLVPFNGTNLKLSLWTVEELFTDEYETDDPLWAGWVNDEDRAAKWIAFSKLRGGNLYDEADETGPYWTRTGLPDYVSVHVVEQDGTLFQYYPYTKHVGIRPIALIRLDD